MPNIPSLESMVGGEIAALVPIFHKTILQHFTLHAVENGGIWVENQKFIDDFFKMVGASSAPKTIIFFLPWNQIVMIWGSLDVPSLSETGFGV